MLIVLASHDICMLYLAKKDKIDVKGTYLS